MATAAGQGGILKDSLGGLLVMHKDEEPISNLGKLPRVTGDRGLEKGGPCPAVPALRGQGAGAAMGSSPEGLLSSLIHYFSTFLLFPLPACPAQDAPPGCHAPITPVALTAPQTLH